MDRAGEMALLVACIDAGGFTSAAERLGLTPSAVSKAVTRLEARLGTRLLERTTRRIAPTAEGRDYIEAARRILADIDEVEAAISARHGAARGPVRANVGVAFAIHQLARELPRFRRLYPEITLELAISDHIVDVIGSGTDVAIRTGPVGDDRLVARKFATTRRIICASPDYLAAHDAPRTHADLAHHTCINITATRHLSLWPFRKPSGEIVTVDTSGPVMVDNAIGALALDLAGFGIVRLGDMILQDPIADGRMVPIMTDTHAADPVPLHLVFPPRRQRVPRVAAFLDFIAETFKHEPWTVKVG